MLRILFERLTGIEELRNQIKQLRFEVEYLKCEMKFINDVKIPGAEDRIGKLFITKQDKE